MKHIIYTLIKHRNYVNYIYIRLRFIIINSYMKRCAFSFDLKIYKYDDFLISNGKSFHSLGAAQANARSPSVIFVLYYCSI